MTDLASTDGEQPQHDGPVDSYGLVLPDPWQRVPLDVNEQRAMLATTATTMRTLDGWTKTHERRLEVSMAHYNASMRAMNASFGAAYIDFWPGDTNGSDDTDGESAEPMLVSANCAIGSFSKQDLGTELPLTPSTLLVVSSNTHVLRESLDRRVVGTTDLEPPELIDLPAGKAVRIRRHQFVRIDAGTARGVYSETFLVPHSSEGERVCVLGFATSNDKLAGDFSPLFLRMAQTLQLLRAGDPTITTSATLD